METDPLTVAGVRVDLEAPASYAERWEVYSAIQDATKRGLPQEVFVRLFAGALGLCCGRLRRYLQRERVEYDGDLRRFGAAVVDFHATKIEGVQPSFMGDIIKAGQAAYRLCEQHLLTADHIKAAEGFSQAPGGSSSQSSSPSSAPGASSQDGSAPYHQRSRPG